MGVRVAIVSVIASEVGTLFLGEKANDLAGKHLKSLRSPRCLIGNWDVVAGQMVCCTISETRDNEDFAAHIRRLSKTDPSGRRVLRQGNFKSKADLKAKLSAFIEYFNQTFAKPMNWTYTGRPTSSPVDIRPRSWREKRTLVALAA